MTIATPHTARTNAHTTGDLPQGKLAHIEHAPPVPGPAAAERGNPDGHRGFLRGPLLSAAGPTSTHGDQGFRSPWALGCAPTGLDSHCMGASSPTSNPSLTLRA